MANIVNFTDKQFENRLNDNLEELVQGKKGYPNFLGVFARNLGVNFGGEKK